VDVRRAWREGREWIVRQDRKTTEMTLLDVPEDELETLLGAIRGRTTIVGVLGKDGPELFAEMSWMDDADEDLIWSTLFIATLDGVRLQHSLAPSRPLKPGPWMSLGAGRYDLEIAFWPDEVFATIEDDRRAREVFESLLGYASGLASECRASTLLLSHGLDEDPRAALRQGREELMVVG
jgi:hypothetical protein